MMSSRFLLRRRVASAMLSRIRRGLPRASSLQTTAVRAIGSSAQADSDHRSRRLHAAALAVAALGSATALLWDEQQQQHSHYNYSVSHCDMAPATSPAAATSSTTLNTTSRITRQRSKARNVMLHRMRSVRARDMSDKYIVDWKTVLGEGAYGSVHPAWLTATGEKVALKKISKRYTSSSSFQTETEALLRIYDNGGHPNISGLRDMYEDYSHFYLILDLVSGGEMFEHLINYGAYSEADAARLMQEAASALAFLHGSGVVHSDLKPENLLLCSKHQSDGTIKIIDFGCAVVSHDNYFSADDALGDDDDDELSQMRPPRPQEPKPSASPSGGTRAYWSPQRCCDDDALPDAAGDMWAVGVILFIMLVGVHPFDVKGTSTDEEIEARIRKNPNPPVGALTGHLSPSAIDLIRKLMEPSAEKRLTAQEMLRHPWIRGDTASTTKIVDSDKRLSRFQELRNKLEAGIFAVLVSHGHPDISLSEANPLTTTLSRRRSETAAPTNLMKRAFEVFDAEGKGFVTSDDLGRVVSQKTGSELSSRDTQDLLAATFRKDGDTNHDGGKSGGATEQMGLSLSDFSNLFAHLKHIHFPRGHVIFRTGDEGDAMYFVASGKVEIRTRKGKLVSILRHGDFFGEGSLLDDQNRRYTSARCATPVDVIKIKREDFERYIRSSSEARNTLRVKWKARQLFYAKNLIRLQTNVKVRMLKKGDVVYREGDVGKSIFWVDEQQGDGAGELEVRHGGVKVHSYFGGESFGESSLLFTRPRSSTVTCVSDTCKLHEMKGEDFLAVLESSPEMAPTLRDMCRKRFLKKAVKALSSEHGRGFAAEDIVAAFHAADTDKSGHLSLNEVRRLMHRMDPTFPEEDVVALLKYIDVDEDGMVSLDEFKRLFRVFERGGPADNKKPFS